MRLLAPLYALGAMLVLAPILIHLFGRDRAVRRRFPAARLLAVAQRRVSPHARIEQWVLVALRALAVLAIAAVLSRPIWERSVNVPSSASLRQAAVIVLDDSLSMSRRERGTSFFSRARSEAQELVRAFPAGSEVAVLSTTDLRRDPLGRLERDRTLVVSAIQRSTVSARTGATTTTLARAAALLASASLPVRRVYLVSDLAAAGFDEAHPRPFEPGTGEGAVGLDVVRIGGTIPPNDAVLSVEVSAGGDRSARRLRVNAHVRSDGQPAHARTVSLLIDGAPVARGLLALPASGSADKRFEYAVPTGAEPRWVEVSLDPDGEDALALDDRRAAPVHGGGGRIVLVDGAPGASRREDETFYLETALRAARGAGAQLEVIHEEQLDKLELDDVAALFLCNPRPSPLLGRLLPFVEAGGGLFIAPGDNLDSSALSGQLAALLPSAIDGTRDLSGPGGVSGGALRFAPPTPALLRRAPSLTDESGRDAWRAARTYRVALLRPIAEEDTSREVLARFEDGTPALQERRVGAGRVQVLATTVDRGWSDLAIQSVFPALAVELAEHLSSVHAGTLEADLLPIGASAAPPFLRTIGDGNPGSIALELTAPNGERTRIQLDPKHPEAAPLVEQPGRYQFAPLDDGKSTAKTQVSFAGVLDPSESDPRLLPDLEHLATPAAVISAARPPAQELWHGVAALLLVLLLAEAVLGLRG